MMAKKNFLVSYTDSKTQLRTKKTSYDTELHSKFLWMAVHVFGFHSRTYGGRADLVVDARVARLLDGGLHIRSQSAFVKRLEPKPEDEHIYHGEKSAVCERDRELRLESNGGWRMYRRDDVGSGVVASAPGGNGGVHMGHAKGLQTGQHHSMSFELDYHGANGFTQNRESLHEWKIILSVIASI
jgi:hypothetical protein